MAYEVGGEPVGLLLSLKLPPHHAEQIMSTSLSRSTRGQESHTSSLAYKTL